MLLSLRWRRPGAPGAALARATARVSSNDTFQHSPAKASEGSSATRGHWTVKTEILRRGWGSWTLPTGASFLGSRTWTRRGARLGGRPGKKRGRLRLLQRAGERERVSTATEARAWHPCSGALLTWI